MEKDKRDLREWVTAKRQYYIDLAEVITQQSNTIEKEFRNINEIIKLKSSLNSEPYAFTMHTFYPSIRNRYKIRKRIM